MIYLIITTSIITKYNNQNEDHRRLRYINCINQVCSIIPNEIKVIIVENNGNRSTYLDQFNNVFYTNNNNVKETHKGINELNDIKQCIENFNIKDDDIIIKLTGRYRVLDDSFFKLILNNKEKDAFVKFYNVCTLQFCDFDCVLGLFAIKTKFIKNFNYNVNSVPEVEFATHVKKNVNNYMEVEKLSLECCFADDLRLLYI